MRIAFKSRAAAGPYKLCHEYSKDGVRFFLEKNARAILIQDWPESAHEGAIALLEYSREHSDGKTDFATDALILKEELLMQWLEGQERHIQRLLELPQLYDGGLQIDSSGAFHMPAFTISYYWQQPNGNRYTTSTENGCFLTVASKSYLLTPHAWRLKNALNKLQERLSQRTQTTERMLDWHEVQQLLDALPEEERQQTMQRSILGNIRLFYANAFRLEAVPSVDGTFDISPVLMRQRIPLNAIEDSTIEHELLLTPILQEKYAAYYAGANTIANCYTLVSGRYIILNDDVQQVLQYIQEVRKRTPEDRLEFLKNPRAALMLDMEGRIDEEVLAAMLSERVTGIGAWQEKVVPYINMKGQQWLPDGKLPENAEKGIRIGEKFLPIVNEKRAREVVKAIADAQAEGKDYFIFENEQHPIAAGLSEGVQSLYEAQPPPQEKDKKEIPTRPVPVVVYSYDNFTEEDGIYKVLRTPRVTSPASNVVPEQLKGDSALKKHQEMGFNWLCRHYRAGSRGVLLADDMGLGKTLQALVFLAWLKQGMDNNEIERLPLLIVAPTGLLSNWKDEINIHLKDGLGDCIDAYGTAISQYRTGRTLDCSRLRQADLILTTYETLNKYQTSFATVRCAAVVFDEMQKVKNPSSQITNAANSLYADFWLGMTGTPVENRLSDLWCITDILQPGMLGTIKEFSNKFEKPLTKEPVSYMHLEKLKKDITEDSDSAPAYMLRRMKDKTLEALPKKHEHFFEVAMPPVQAQAYISAIESIRREGEKGQALMALQRIRAISLHPDYKRIAYGSDDPDSFINASARLRKCFELLETIKKKGEKALIFVEYNDWQNFLPELIAQRFNIPRPLNINGSISGQERQKRVKQFQTAPSGFDVMLISPKAGGVGLTLTAANHVIHLTRWWNPAVEDQATDRVYRIRQQKEVHVYYPLAIHPEIERESFDVLLNELLENKRSLSRNTLMPVIDNEADIREFFDKAIWQKRSGKITKSDLDAFTGQEFQFFTKSRLQKGAAPLGLTVLQVQASHDGGADIIIKTSEGDILAIIQCKHSGNPNSTTTGSEDVRRAFERYGMKGGFGITVTNAKASSLDKKWQSENPDKHLILEGMAALYPEKILDYLN